MLCSVPISVGRMYNEPGGSGVISALADTVAATIVSNSSAGGGGNISRWALECMRWPWRPARKVRTVPSCLSMCFETLEAAAPVVQGMRGRDGAPIGRC